MEINILGTEYTITECRETEQPRLSGNDGFIDTSTKEIYIDASLMAPTPYAKENLMDYRRKVIRHEIIHGALYESGLDTSSWAANEEIVDWIAVQYPKLKAIFEEAGCG